MTIFLKLSTMLLPFLSAFFIADAAILFRIVLQTLFKT